MKHLISAGLVSLLIAGPAYAQDAGIKFDEMKVGTTLVTQSLSGKKRILSATYIGKQGNLFVMEEHWLNGDGTKVNVGTVYYDAKGRETGSNRRRGKFIYTPFSCMFAVGDCRHTYDYPNSFSKKKSKRTKTVSRYKNRLEGGTFYVTWKLVDGTIAEVPFKLGPYNFRVSSRYKNTLGQLRGHKLIKIVEPSGEQSSAGTKQKSSSLRKEGPADCQKLYAALKAKAPGDVSICEAAVKEPKFLQCKAPTRAAADRPSAHVVLALDASGSMAGKLGGKSKMATAKVEAERFLSAIEKDVPVGLIVYGHRGDNSEAGKAESCAAVEWAQRISPRRGWVKKNIAELKPVGWTPLAGALDYLNVELAKVRRKPNDKLSVPVVYIISDGRETCGGDPVASARALHRSDVQAAVNVIGFDVDDKTRAELEAISKAGGGKYFPAKDSKSLRKQLDAARESEAKLARYNYCVLQNLGRAAVVHHNATIETTGCYHRESKNKRRDLIGKWTREFKTPEEKSCAAVVKRLAYADYIKDSRWLTEASKRMRAASSAAMDAARAKWDLRTRP